MATRVDLQVGDSFSKTPVGPVGRKPKWLHYTANTTLSGNAELPSGHRSLVYSKPSGTDEDDLYVIPIVLPDTDADWRMVIYAPNGSYITAEGIRGIPIIGTPTVRIGVNAPSKATVRIPVMRGAPNILDSTFAGWSDSHTEAVKRGMELTVEYRGPSGLRMVFRGQIYQIDKGNVLEITAYDRVMDLYQYSDQYQSHQGRKDEWVDRTGDNGTQYTYRATSNIGTMTAVQEEYILRINALSQMTIGQSREGYIAHNLPSDGGYSPVQGSSIKRMATLVTARRSDVHFTSRIRISCKPYLYYKSGGILNEVYAGDWASAVIDNEGTATLSWSIDWYLGNTVSNYYIGVQYTYEVLAGGYNVHGAAGTTTRYTTSDYYISSNGTTWEATSSSGNLPEISIDFTMVDSVNLANVTYSGQDVLIDKAAMPEPSDTYLSTIDKGVRAYLDYFMTSGVSLQGVVADLIIASRLQPNISGSIDMGTTDYYTSSTFDYLTCIQEIVNGGNCGIRMAVDEPGRIDVLPRHTASETAVATFSASFTGVGERNIVNHDLTAHWMAEKATVAMIAENATSSGLPLALETDDGLMDGSLIEALQSPLRGISADATMGTHILMAYSAGGKVRQLHTNIVEGSVTVSGYRTDIWDFNGSYVGGKPVKIVVPDAGVDHNVVPTEIEYGDGVTVVKLDNIRRADRSEVARSMGLTADGVSNASKLLPSTCWLFAKVTSYTTQETGITPGIVTSVKCKLDDSTTVAEQNDTNYIKTLKDPAGYYHICAVIPSTPAGWSPANPMTWVQFIMGGNTYSAILENRNKYALGGQAIHVDIRFRPSA